MFVNKTCLEFYDFWVHRYLDIVMAILHSFALQFKMPVAIDFNLQEKLFSKPK